MSESEGWTRESLKGKMSYLSLEAIHDVFDDQCNADGDMCMAEALPFDDIFKLLTLWSNKYIVSLQSLGLTKESTVFKSCKGSGDVIVSLLSANDDIVDEVESEVSSERSDDQNEDDMTFGDLARAAMAAMKATGKAPPKPKPKAKGKATQRSA